MTTHWLAYGAVIFSVSLIYAIGWHLSRPMVIWGRWLFRFSLLALLSGLTLPADAIAYIVQVLAQVFPHLREVSNEPSASVGMHLILFLLVSALLPSLRLDLKTRFIVVALVTLALVTEFLQALIPGRFFDWRDVATNLVGVSVGLVVRGVAQYTRSGRYPS